MEQSQFAPPRFHLSSSSTSSRLDASSSPPAQADSPYNLTHYNSSNASSPAISSNLSSRPTTSSGPTVLQALAADLSHGFQIPDDHHSFVHHLPLASTSSLVFQPPPQPGVTAPKKKKTHSKPRPEGHVPRPRNPFIMFRMDVVEKKLITSENKHQNISKVVADMWKAVSIPSSPSRSSFHILLFPRDQNELAPLSTLTKLRPFFPILFLFAAQPEGEGTLPGSSEEGERAAQDHVSFFFSSWPSLPLPRPAVGVVRVELEAHQIPLFPRFSCRYPNYVYQPLGEKFVEGGKSPKRVTGSKASLKAAALKEKKAMEEEQRRARMERHEQEEDDDDAAYVR